MRMGWLLAFIILFQAPYLGAHVDVGPVIVELEAKDVVARSAIAQIIHIDSVFEDRVYSVVNSADLARLRQLKEARILSIEVLTDSWQDTFSPWSKVSQFPLEDDDFHTYEEMVADLKSLEQQYPDLLQVFSIGQSTNAQEIWAVKISANVSATDESKKAITYMGTHHAREHVSTEIPLLFARELVENYATNEEIASLLKRIDVYIIPMVNPDGAMFDIENGRYKWWRKNRRSNDDKTYGVDLNRNYGFGWGTGGSSTSPSSDIYMGPAPFSEPETKSIRDFFKKHPNVTMALSFHTFSELILYPWGNKSSGIGGKDERIFKKMANDMAAMNHYRPMQSSGLYIASGDTCDYLYGELKIYCLTFELSPSSMFQGGFYPGEAIIPRVFESNLAPMLYMAKLADNPQQVLAE